MFTIDEENGEIVIPEEFEAKVKGWLKNDKDLVRQLKNQVIIYLI